MQHTGPANQGQRPLQSARRALLAAVSTPAQLDSFPASFSASADSFLLGLFERASGGDHAGLALVAVGGYGRSELFPESDIDVFLVHRDRRDAEEVARRIWYPVWDDGTRLDASVRTVREALAVAREDLPAAVGMLDSRLVAGDAGLAGQLQQRLPEMLQARAGEFLGELGDAISVRHAQQGEVAFLLEPDLKEAHGGLRDANALRAAGRVLPRIAPSLELDSLLVPLATLARVRCALHICAGRRGDRLLLERQDDVAALCGFDDADALMAAVAAAGREIAWSSDEGWRRIRSSLAGPRGRVAARDRPLSAGLVLREGEVALAAPPSAGEDVALLLLRAASEAAGAGLPLAAGLAERLARQASPPPEPWPAELRHAFVGVLGGRAHAVTVLESLDRARFLELLLPEWAAVRNKPQRNAYHRFTVDRHLLETVARAGTLARSVSRPDLLLLAALLHDIGKGFAGDHTEVGTRLAPAMLARMGYDEQDCLLVGRLVEHHLLLADTATRRDLEDPQTVASVAAAVGDLETLELLGALARADGEATGPAAWGRWKEGLVEELCRRVAEALEAEPGAGAGERPPPAVPEELFGAWTGGRLGVAVAPAASGLVTVTVVGPDQPGLMAAAAGVVALHGLAVRTAAAGVQAGVAVERFDAEPGPGGVPEASRLLAELQAELAGTLRVHERLAEIARAYAPSRRASPAAPDVRVRIDNTSSARATIVEVRAADTRGLLHQLAAVLAAAGLDIASAHVGTLGHEVVDTFYVTTAGGGRGGEQSRKLTDPAEIERLAEALAQAVEGGKA
jgi:[protein-PII] uridylyltransferase